MLFLVVSREIQPAHVPVIMGINKIFYQEQLKEK